MKLIFFSDNHLAPKFFKVVANSKKVGHHFQRQTKPHYYAVSVQSVSDTRMDDIQRSSSPKSKMVSSY